MIEIKKIPFQINEHNPKAQSVCEPDEKIGFNEFFANLQTQIKNLYEHTRSTTTEEGIRIRKNKRSN